MAPTRAGVIRFTLPLLLLAVALAALPDPALGSPEDPTPKPAVKDPCAPECPPCDPYPCCECKKPEPAPCPPKGYANMRFDENWRPCLCVDPCDRPDWTDRIKAFGLTSNKSIWANVGGQARVRFESWNNQGFGAPAHADDDSGLLRLRAHGDVHFGEHVRVFVEGIWAYEDGRDPGPRPIDVNKGDLLNLFAEVSGPLGSLDGAGLRVGRQELQMGKQRLISPLDWVNTRRVFEGARGWAKWDGHRVDAFWTRPVNIKEGALDDEWNEDAAFFGAYYQNTTWNCVSWDAYVLGLRRTDAAYGGVTEDESRWTLGARVDGKIPNTRFDYEAEGGWQFGTFGDGDISAGFASLVLGWSPCWGSWQPRLALGLDYAGGDDEAGDEDVGTFQQLFPLGHAYLGFADLIGRQNILAANFQVGVKPAKDLELKATYHGFWRADENDAVYNAGGGVLRAASGSSETFVGTEIDVTVEYKFKRHWAALLGWSHFFPGDFIDETGAHEDVDLVYLQLQWTI